eukprot:1336985-Amorphochlora_amoeboformis.AAC.1
MAKASSNLTSNNTPTARISLNSKILHRAYNLQLIVHNTQARTQTGSWKTAYETLITYSTSLFQSTLK